MQNLKPVRCQNCERKLLEITGSYRLAIVCRKCKFFNQFQAA